MAKNEEPSSIPHILFFPFPIQGHMPPMLKLASHMSSFTNFYVTFLNTEHSHNTFLGLDTFTNHQTSNFRFKTIPDGLPSDNPRKPIHFLELEESLRTKARTHYKNILLEKDDVLNWPPISLVISDAILAVGIEVANEVGLPVMVFRTSSACSFWVFRCVHDLVQRGDIPFPDDADYDELIEGIEGLECLRRRDLPSFCREVNCTTDPRLQILATITNNASKAKALIINTFESLEAHMLSCLRSFCPVIYPVGPVHILSKTGNREVNLWHVDSGCMPWLDKQEPRSVVFVSLGSLIVMSKDDITELWHGLVDSGRKFLWVVRQGLVTGESVTSMIESSPEELEEGTRERGCLVSWAPQKEVLGHPAVGCFLTHSGWNSTVESVVAGVPMICWPSITDQTVNSRFVSEVWKMGVDMKDCEGREIVRRKIDEVMEGEKAEEMRTSVEEMGRKAKASMEAGGDSYLNVQKLIDHIAALSYKQ